MMASAGSSDQVDRAIWSHDPRPSSEGTSEICGERQQLRIRIRSMIQAAVKQKPPNWAAFYASVENLFSEMRSATDNPPKPAAYPALWGHTPCNWVSAGEGNGTAWACPCLGTRHAAMPGRLADANARPS